MNTIVSADGGAAGVSATGGDGENVDEVVVDKEASAWELMERYQVAIFELDLSNRLRCHLQKRRYQAAARPGFPALSVADMHAANVSVSGGNLARRISCTTSSHSSVLHVIPWQRITLL